MPIKMNLNGQRFGKLVVIGESKKRANGSVHWWCQCDCGNLTCVSGSQLKLKRKKSCGCLQKEITLARQITHNQSKSRTFRIWDNMLTRCNNPNSDRYHDYGGRGIKVCKKWHIFQNFYNDMGDCPEGHSIERVDNDGPYSPSNCKWIPLCQQVWNTRARGYSWNEQDQKWRARIRSNYKQIHLGCFDTEKEARQAYQKAKNKRMRGEI